MTRAKPLYRFRDRALAGLMAARGWNSEGPRSGDKPRKLPLIAAE